MPDICVGPMRRQFFKVDVIPSHTVNNRIYLQSRKKCCSPNKKYVLTGYDKTIKYFISFKISIKGAKNNTVAQNF